jgi:hypothetical protein
MSLVFPLLISKLPLYNFSLNLQEVFSMLLQEGEPRLEGEYIGIQKVAVV